MIYKQLTFFKDWLIHDSVILGVDYGHKHIGLALYNHSLNQTYTLGILEHRNLNSTLINLDNLIINKAVNRIIIGLPVLLDGSYSSQTRRVLSFAHSLNNFLELKDKHLAISFYDETLTTQMFSKSKLNTIDDLSAYVILQEAVDSIIKSNVKILARPEGFEPPT